MWHEGSNTATWFEAFGVWAAVIVALFWEWIRDWLLEPKLVLRRGPPQLSIQKTKAYLPDVPGVLVPCYYCHLEVANEGRRAARNVEVFLSGVDRRDEGGVWVPEERFIPEWLWWVTIRQLARTGLPGIY